MKRLAKILVTLAVILAALFLIFRTPDTDPAAMHAKYGGPPSQFVGLGNGMRVHLRDEGARGGVPIVLLHGSNADLHTWQPWVDRLKATHRLIRFDQRGHGLTGPAPDNDYSRKAFADDVERVADKLKLNRFVLAGNSMGGGIAIEYALAHPQRLAGLVLIDASGAPVTGKAKGNIGFTLARMPGTAFLMRSITPRSLIDKSVHQTVLNKSVVSDAMVDRYWELLRYPGNRQATATRFATALPSFTPSQLAGLKVPTLIIWGEGDPLIPLSSGRWLAQHIPGARMEMLPGIGHIPMEEAPDATARMLEGWLAAAASPPVKAATR